MNTQKPLPFKRNTWMESQIRHVGRSRFPAIYWPALDKAISTCLESHSYIIVNEGNHSAICQWQIAEPGIPNLAAFILVCPPFSDDVAEYGLQTTPVAMMYEIAFVAVATHAEGRGFARQLVQHVLHTTPLPCWLHVDTVNVRAKKLYESLGMMEYRLQPDPYGSEGSVMISDHLEGWRDSYIEIGPTLFNACPRQAEQTFRRCILAPPLMAGY